MNKFVALDEIEAIVSGKRSLPTITMWNRLRPYPRQTDFDRALRAEVRDAAWMVSRQWQLGEFKGEDAGSPILAKLLAAQEQLSAYSPHEGDTRTFDDTLPLETLVEQRKVPFGSAGRELSLDIRIAMGRRWLKAMAAIGNFRSHFVSSYPIDRPEPAVRGDAWASAHGSVLQSYAAVSGRMMDGYKLLRYLEADPSHRAHDGLTTDAAEQASIDSAADKYRAWYAGLFAQPEDANSAWVPNRMEYQFAVASQKLDGERVLNAEEYYHGHLDWYNFRADSDVPSIGSGAAPASAVPETIVRSFLPTAVSFEGMPHTRWWAFEDGKTSFGDIDADTTELAKLLVIEFGLVFANDWFLLPMPTSAGALLSVRGLAVTNTFGERLLVSPSRDDNGTVTQTDDFGLFELTGAARSDDPVLLMLPTSQHVLEQRTHEEIALVRDEMANMIWGIEEWVPMADGTSRKGREAGLETRAMMERLLRGTAGTPDPDAVADLRYKVMTSVPEHWIPFIGVNLADSDREIILQRASMPRIIPDAPSPPERVKPRTNLLRQGLDQSPKKAYYLNEEEVPRAGVKVSSQFRRTRWYDGKPVVWFGHRKVTGRGEAASGLNFDRLVPTGGKRS